MTRMLLLGAGTLSLLVLAGCTSGPLGPRGAYRPTQPARTGQPVSRPPIAGQPVVAPTSTASSVRVVPFAALPRHAMVQLQQGLQVGGRSAFQTGVRPLGLLASNERLIDGRSLPLFDRTAQYPRAGGATALASLLPESSFGESTASALAPGSSATPHEDLKYRGGRTIRDLVYISLFVGGSQVWDAQDWRSIDRHLAAAMSDPHLNNVLRQYFGNQPVSATFQRSYFLSGWQPQRVTKDDLERQLLGLHSAGAFSGYDLAKTCINVVLPRGTILSDPGGGPARLGSGTAIPQDEAADSTGGLAGYHGSIQAGGDTIYFATAVYSERLSNGTTNGIPVFDQNWKNVVATLYHQLQEVRTDPDVDEALRDGTPAGTRFLGWTSDSGLEIGDYPILGAQQLRQVFVEVPLADGSGTVPIQLPYSNAVHGPEGPIPTPHGSEPSPAPQPPQPTTDPELAKVVNSWNQLEDYVKRAILRLAGAG